MFGFYRQLLFSALHGAKVGAEQKEKVLIFYTECVSFGELCNRHKGSALVALQGGEDQQRRRIGAVAIRKFEGDCFNVVGLPVNRVYEALKNW